MLFSNKSQITLLNADGRARVFRRGRNICAQRYDRYYGVCVIKQFYPINQRISIVDIPVSRSVEGFSTYKLFRTQYRKYYR
jgi:hypothetical protein